MRKRAFVIVAMSALFFIVNGMDFAEAAQMGSRERVNAYIEQHSNLAPGIVTAMNSLRLATGMTEGQVKATWGEPIKIIRYAGGREKWLFTCDYPHPCKRKGPPGSRRWVYKSKPSALFLQGRVSGWSR